MNLNRLTLNHISSKLKKKVYFVFYNIDSLLHINIFSHSCKEQRELSSLKGIHKGETAILIGNGPSVSIEDLEKVKKVVTFCFNRFHLAYTMTGFRPKYTISSDPQMIEDFGSEIVEKSESTLFIVSIMRPPIKGKFYWIPINPSYPFIFSEKIYRYISPGGSGLVSAIQIAYFMGIKKMILYGIDHSFKFKLNTEKKDHYRKARGDNNHFIKDYRSGKPWCPPSTELIEQSLKSCDEFLRQSGGWLKNSTRGGKLEVLERIDFDHVLKHNLC